MLPPATRTQDLPTPPVPPVAPKPAEAQRLRPDGGPQGRSEGAAAAADRSAEARPRPQGTKAAPGEETALAEEHDRALGRGRLIDVLG